MPLPLSICIPTYNRARLLERALGLLSQQTDCFAELVISDNASPDDTGAVVDAFRSRLPALRYVRQSKNHGAMRNIFATMMLASSEFLYVLADDDELIPDGIRRAVAALQADDDCVAVYGGYERCDADLRTTVVTVVPPSPGRFTRADMEALARNQNMLAFPVARTAAIQRHCFSDQTTLGLMRWMTQLLARGSVQVVPYAVYRHGDTPGRTEEQMTEGWYHDSLRTDWEIYAATMGALPFHQVLNIVTNCTVPLYPTAQTFAHGQDKPLVERTFLLRYLAYARATDPSADIRIREWERTRLVAAVIDRLGDRLDMIPDLRRVVVEAGDMNVAGMMRHVRASAGAPALIERSPEAFRRLPAEPGDFLLAEYWDALSARAASHADDPTHRLAVGDLIASLRIPYGAAEPRLEGPDGALHLSRL